jgi:hypothetical protein
MSTTTPVYTGNAAGNVDASASLGAGSDRSASWDISGKFEGQVHVKNTPGGTIAVTRGLLVQVFRQYGNSPTTAQTPFLTYTMPSATASTAESLTFWLGPGKYSIKLTNLDASNAITVEVTGDTVDSLLNTA